MDAEGAIHANPIKPPLLESSTGNAVNYLRNDPLCKRFITEVLIPPPSPQRGAVESLFPLVNRSQSSYALNNIPHVFLGFLDAPIITDRFPSHESRREFQKIVEGKNKEAGLFLKQNALKRSVVSKTLGYAVSFPALDIDVPANLVEKAEQLRLEMRQEKGDSLDLRTLGRGENGPPRDHYDEKTLAEKLDFVGRCKALSSEILEALLELRRQGKYPIE